MFKMLSCSPCHKGCCTNDYVKLQNKGQILEKDTHTKTQKSLGDLDSASYMFNVVTMCFNQTKLISWERSRIYMVPSFCIREGNGTPLQYSCLSNPMDGGAWQAAVHGVARSWMRLSDFTFTFHFHALEKEMATHSSVLAWRIPGTGEPGGLPSMGSHRVEHD